MMEYGISRERFLFTIDPNVKGQGASNRLAGPGVPLSEVAALYSMTQRRTPFLLASARELLTKKRVLNLDAEIRGNWWGNALALYRATGDQAWLEKARAGADQYLAERVARKQVDFSDPDSRGMFFWPSYVPNWAELYELWQETQEQRYLDAALSGARSYTEFIWMCPRIPEGEVLVNQGGKAPLYRTGKQFSPIELPEERVPAWRVSEIGLTPESSGTSKGHRGILLASYAPYFLRIARDSNDDFLRAVGRSAVIGRYTTFPGYHMNTARTTVYEKPDFPIRPMAQLNSTTSLHYNHIWAQIAMVMDYLVSDAAARSGGQIDFPSQFAEGYGYVTSKVYGDRPGRFYQDRDVWLWMPKGLVSSASEQVNYVAARGNGKVYLVLTNQSSKPVTTTIALDSKLARGSGRHAVAVWRQNQPAPASEMNDGVMTVSLAPSGITALAIEGIVPQVRFQDKIAGPAGVGAWKRDSAEVSVGRGHAVVFNLGPDLRSVYTYLEANGSELRSATLKYSTGGEWKEIRDTSYPFEFTVPIDRSLREFRFRYEVVRHDNTTARSEEGRLHE